MVSISNVVESWGMESMENTKMQRKYREQENVVTFKSTTKY